MAAIANKRSRTSIANKQKASTSVKDSEQARTRVSKTTGKQVSVTFDRSATNSRADSKLRRDKALEIATDLAIALHRDALIELEKH